MNPIMQKSISLFILISFLGFLSNSLPAQSRISGIVQNAEGAGIEGANVLLLNTDSTFVRGGVAGEQGRFRFDRIKVGSYLIKASYVGHPEMYTSVFDVVSNNEVELDPISLIGGITLDGGTVTRTRPLYVPKIDRLVINIASSVIFKGTTVLDVLEGTQGIFIDRQNNRISLMGKDGVNVMENGRLRYMPVSALLQYLNGISSDNVERIELITTPPAKFDAEGDAGYINIVLKKRPDEGLNGSFSLSYGYGKGQVSNNSINLNFRKNKLFLFGNYSFLLKDQEQSFTTKRAIQAPDALQESNSNGIRLPTQRDHNLRFGMEYQLSDKTEIGGLLSAYDNHLSMDALTRNDLLRNRTLYTVNSVEAIERNQWRHYGANFNISHRFSDSENISIDADYLYYRNENPIDYANTVSDGTDTFLEEILTRSSKVTPLDILVGNLDYHKDLNGGMKLDAGVKAVRSTFENSVLVETLKLENWLPEASLSSNSKLAEEILAAYLSTDLQLGQKTSAKIGLRYEYTNSRLDSETDGRVIDRQFGKLFPSAFLTHKFSESISGNLSYSRRITRPTFREMAPFAFLIDPSTFFAGNAAIQPAISDAFKVDLRYKTLFFSVQYTVQDSAIARFQQRYDSEANRLLLVSENIKNSKIFSFTIGYPLQITRWWSSRSNAMYFYQENNAYVSDRPFQLTRNYVQLNTTHSFKLPKGFSSELAFFYNSPRINGALNFGEIYGLNLGLQKQLGGQWGSLRLNVSDVLNSVVMRGNVEVPDQNLAYTGIFDLSQRTFTLNYSRSFGNQKLKSGRKRQRGAAEERNRMN